MVETETQEALGGETIKRRRLAVSCVRNAPQRLDPGLAISHFRSLDPDLRVTAAMRFALDELYRHFVSTMVRTLARFRSETKIRRALEAYTRYHLAGLKALFEPWPEPAGTLPQGEAADE